MGLLGQLLNHPEEIPSLVKVRLAQRAALKLPHNEDLAFCYDMLNRVSRSFAVVIQQLGPELRDAVCIFYLVLRALDTVEDDMSIKVSKKVPILKVFHEKLYDVRWTYLCGEKDYKRLMEGLSHVNRAFLALDKRYQDVIADITKRMGAGMAEFIEKEVISVADWDLYCHYVAGLVGLGLSDLFASSGLEDLQPEHLSNSMGLFLQKANIIRDYLEDINELPAPRMFWPRCVWSKYAKRLEDLKKPENSVAAVQCMNELITDALRHLPDSLNYLAAIKDPAIFRFCAIPQVMAIGTLALCYNNHNVFTGVVKMRKGQAARIMDRTKSMKDVYQGYYFFLKLLRQKVDKRDPNAALALKRVGEGEGMCESSKLLAKEHGPFADLDASSRLLIVLFFLVYVIYVYFEEDLVRLLSLDRAYFGATAPKQVVAGVVVSLCALALVKQLFA